MRVVTILRSGQDFAPVHVQALQKQIHKHSPNVEFLCIADVPVPKVETVIADYDWPTWWLKMEIFRPSIEAPFLYMDLDTVVRGPLDDFFEGHLPGTMTGLKDSRPGKFGNGLLWVPGGVSEYLWNEWLLDPKKHMAHYEKSYDHRIPRYDQGFMEDRISCQHWEDILPGRLTTAQEAMHKGFRPGQDIVICWGRRRPWHLPMFSGLYR